MSVIKQIQGTYGRLPPIANPQEIGEGYGKIGTGPIGRAIYGAGTVIDDMLYDLFGRRLFGTKGNVEQIPVPTPPETPERRLHTYRPEEMFATV